MGCLPQQLEVCRSCSLFWISLVEQNSSAPQTCSGKDHPCYPSIPVGHQVPISEGRISELSLLHILEAVGHSMADLATKIFVTGNVLCAVFFEEDVITDILECEIFEWQYIHSKKIMFNLNFWRFIIFIMYLLCKNYKKINQSLVVDGKNLIFRDITLSCKVFQLLKLMEIFYAWFPLFSWIPSGLSEMVGKSTSSLCLTVEGLLTHRFPWEAVG